MKLFLHVCCAPDLIAADRWLKKENIHYTTFFYNPNIHPFEEYKKRVEAFEKLKKMWNFDDIKADYDPKKFFEHVKGFENNEPERCKRCIYLRLKETAKKAKEFGFNVFSTTLLASPRKSLEEIKEIGEVIAKKEKIDFFFYNFRKENTVSYSAKFCRYHGIYRQNYCGCIFSLKEAIKAREISRKRRLQKLKEIVDDSEVSYLKDLIDKDMIRIPEDISAKILLNSGLIILEILKAKIVIIRKEIARELKLPEGKKRIKINKWKGKIIVI